MNSLWTRTLEKQRAIDVEQNFKESSVMRKRLCEMLVELIDESNTTCRSKLLYDNPNWALLQADDRGYQRALAKVISLIS